MNAATKLYTIQVSNHPGAGARIPTQAASESWRTLYDGPAASDADVRAVVDELAAWYRHVRAFKGSNTLGRMLYAQAGLELETDRARDGEAHPAQDYLRR